jgi:L-alanine-DL-glutamate epimerase-like enolase superfamily enzyme
VRGDTRIDRLDVRVYDVPTDAPEADGTLTWSSTTVVLVQATAGGATGTGWTYSAAACKPLVDDQLAPVVVGRDVLDVGGAWEAMVRTCRNLGRPGIVSTAIAAVDLALWDLKSRLLDLPLCRLLGQFHEQVPIYGSGGFTTYDETTLRSQLEHWANDLQIRRMKIKIGESWGSRTDRDLARVRQTREIVGDDVELYVDANGGYTVGQAVRTAQALTDSGVTWFEEPVSSDDLAGLAQVRQQVLPDVTAGEYGYDLVYMRRMCQAGAVDCLQVDVTRCAGITDWLRAAAVAASFGLDVSAHCAPAQHAHPAAAIPNLRHLEYFHDHVRIEQLFFDGVLDPVGGGLRPDQGRPGNGLTLREADAQPFLRG